MDRSDDEIPEQLALPFGDSHQPGERPLLLTERQVCKLLNIGRTTLRSLALRPTHVNRCVRYRLTDVERYIAGLS